MIMIFYLNNIFEYFELGQVMESGKINKISNMENL